MPKITQTLSHVLGMNLLDQYFFPKNSATQKIEEFLKVRVSLLPLHYGPVVKNLTLIFCPKNISWLLHMYIYFEKFFGQNVIVKFFTVAL